MDRYDPRIKGRRTEQCSVDYGPQPFVADLDRLTQCNNAFRSALWTGEHLQLTLMSIPVGEDIGLEIHPATDQLLKIEQGSAVVRMGYSQCNLNMEKKVWAGFVIIVPAGTWHNVINTGSVPLKLYSVYAPPQHPRGTVHPTKADAQAAEQREHR